MVPHPNSISFFKVYWHFDVYLAVKADKDKSIPDLVYISGAHRSA
jgi:hypothetical protein